MRLPTGVSLLDRMLDGGIPERSSVLVYGGSFLGKEELADHMILANLAAGTPVILILTHTTAQETRRRLAGMEPRYKDWETAGLVWFVDTYSASIDADEDLPHVEYVDSSVDMNGISLAVNKVQGEVIPMHERHLLLIDSVSTMVIQNRAAPTFRVLQVLVGKAKRAGAASLLLLDEGMHSDAEVQMFRHLVTGAISVRGDPEKHQLLVEGLGLQKNPGWLEYEFTDKQFKMTGSLAGGRIR